MVITVQYIISLIAALILTAIAIALETDRFAKFYSAKTLHLWRNIVLTILVILIVYLCISNFPVSLTLLVFFTGIIALIDLLFFARKRKGSKQKPNVIVENARGFFPILLIVWVIRSFIVQPYHVPTGSLEPTVMAGDFIAANQFAYGLKFPIGNIKLIPVGEPKVGDIVLFYNPVNPAIVLIKRTIGTPGDHIVYKNKILYVNEKEATQQYIGTGLDVEPNQMPIFTQRKSEDLNGVKHEIFVWPDGGETQDFDFVVPQGMYFMMGDNRDDSDDSRMGFGSGELTFVPERNLIGKAFLTLISWDANNFRVRWDRTGKKIQ